MAIMDDQEILNCQSCITEDLNIVRSNDNTSLFEDTVASSEDSTSIAELLNIIKNRDTEINSLRKRAEKAERLLKKANSYNEDLKAELASLSSELHNFRSLKKRGQSVLLQVSEKDLEEAYGEKPMPTWSASAYGESNDAPVSISESLKAAAEEVVHGSQFTSNEEQIQPSSDYVFDAQTGFYYHPASGYYWDPASSLFYDYTSGTYYQYDEATGEYVVHSQVDVTGNSTYQKSQEEGGDDHHQKKMSSGKRKRKFKRQRQSKLQHKGQVDTEEGEVIDLDNTSEEKSGKLTPHDMDKTSEENSALTNSTVSCENGTEIIEVSTDTDDNTESSGSLATGESEMVSSPESREINDEAGENIDHNPKIFSADALTYDQQMQYTQEIAESHPPCIRLIVLQSEHLHLGSLSIITCAGGTIGREPNMGHAIDIPDLNVSKVHAEVHYDYDCNCYHIIDKGSQNGTLLNNKRLSESKLESAAYPLNHGDILEVGSSRLLLHIHTGHETCEECEPGQVQAKIRALNPIKNDYTVLSKGERNKQRLQELKQLKKKYGLQKSHFESTGASFSNPEYCDKAYLRRKFVGSEPPESPRKSEENAASVQNPISATNKGHKLLSKMGWKEGEGLGKTNSGIAAPINVELRVNQSAGLGSTAGFSLSLDNVHQSRKAKRWTTARQMYDKLEAQGVQSGKHTSQDVKSTSGATKNIPASSPYTASETSSLTPYSDDLNVDTGSPHSGQFSSPKDSNNSSSLTTPTSAKKYSSVPKISWVKGATQKATSFTSNASFQMEDSHSDPQS